MKFGKMSMLALSTMLGGSLLWAGEVSAACTNTHRPQAFTYSQRYADGTRLVQVDTWDSDNLAKRRLFVYRGGTLIKNSASGFVSMVMPKGAGTWTFHTPNFDTCGGHTQVTWVSSFSN